jgi:8-oxo-dGTP diphosphatase
MRRMPEVHAAGAVVHRQGDAGPAFAIIHRPHRDDWSLPKGKLDTGEDFEGAAVREVQEEIGVTGALGEELPPVRYEDHKGRPKVVRYWLMEAVDPPAFEENDEVDELRWLPGGEALELLTHDLDRGVLQSAIDRL